MYACKVSNTKKEKRCLPSKMSKTAFFICRKPSPAMVSDVSKTNAEQIPLPCWSLFSKQFNCCVRASSVTCDPIKVFEKSLSTNYLKKIKMSSSNFFSSETMFKVNTSIWLI